jgi:murein DD-endopeptidase MepM/ murein hydrolase activator NlpD
MRVATRLGAVFAALLLAACGQAPAPVLYGGQGRAALPPLESALPQASPVTPKTRARSGAQSAPNVVLVRPGETLYQIARRNRVALRALIEANRLLPPYAISPGQRLVLPRARLHRVQDGESLYAVSRRYGVDMSALVRVNNIRPPYRLTVGQTLRLPGAGPAPLRRANAAKRRAFKPDGSRPPASYRATRTARPPSRAELANPPARSSKKFLWPVRGTITIGFGPRGRGRNNDGINILARRGTPVRAVENGIVAYSGNELRGFGNLLLIRHAGGWTSAYAHNQILLVRAGDRVRRGQIISRVGTTGSVRRPQLHFELRRGRRAVDPVRYMTRRGSRRSVGFLIPAGFPDVRPGPG